MFGTGARASLREHATAASFEHRPLERLTLQVAAGAVLGGRIDIDETRHRIEQGPLGAVAVAYRFFDAPFVLGSLSLAHSIARTRDESGAGDSVLLRASDARVGLAIGTTLARVISPYVLARAFGGPVSWTHRGERVVGSDRYHYQLGLGVALAPGGGIDAAIEAAVFGERRATVTLGASF